MTFEMPEMFLYILFCFIVSAGAHPVLYLEGAQGGGAACSVTQSLRHMGPALLLPDSAGKEGGVASWVTCPGRAQEGPCPFNCHVLLGVGLHGTCTDLLEGSHQSGSHQVGSAVTFEDRVKMIGSMGTAAVLPWWRKLVAP